MVVIAMADLLKLSSRSVSKIFRGPDAKSRGKSPSLRNSAFSLRYSESVMFVGCNLTDCEIMNIFKKNKTRYSCTTYYFHKVKGQMGGHSWRGY